MTKRALSPAGGEESCLFVSPGIGPDFLGGNFPQNQIVLDRKGSPESELFVVGLRSQRVGGAVKHNQPVRSFSDFFRDLIQDELVPVGKAGAVIGKVDGLLNILVRRRLFPGGRRGRRP